MNFRLSGVFAIAFLAALVANVNATELVYIPVNPNFGGNPLNGPMLLNNAQSTNLYDKDPDALLSAPKKKSDLEEFNDQLQRAILNRIAAAVSGGIVDANGNLIPGTVSTTDFTIVIVDNGDGTLTITTTDKTTGDTTSFTISAAF